jgi:hypothetical protein
MTDVQKLDMRLRARRRVCNARDAELIGTRETDTSESKAASKACGTRAGLFRRVGSDNQQSTYESWKSISTCAIADNSAAVAHCPCTATCKSSVFGPSELVRPLVGQPQRSVRRNSCVAETESASTALQM